MESIDVRIMVRYCVYSALVAVFVVCVPIAALSSVVVAACVDAAMQLDDYDVCSWVVLVIFAVSLSVECCIGVFLLRRSSKLDRALCGAIAGVGVFLFLEYVAGLAGYGSLSSLFIMALGYMVSGRERWKVTWKPPRQFFALFLVAALSISLYTLGPDHVPVSLSLFDNEYLKLHVPLMLRLAGEAFIVVAVMHFGRGALEYILAATR